MAARARNAPVRSVERRNMVTPSQYLHRPEIVPLVSQEGRLPHGLYAVQQR
jgi:hypothetical protein